MAVSLVEYFSELKDSRLERNKLHALPDILVLVVCAMISGAEGWEDIAAFWAKGGSFDLLPRKSFIPQSPFEKSVPEL